MADFETHKRIAKNTLLLYGRMAITVVVGLFTSRLVLQALGENDYGIYSVVGGIVVVLAFLNSSLAGATQRFLNFELGRHSIKNVKEVFKTSLQLHIGVALIVLLLAETIGLWFLNTKMNIVPSSMKAANWVYQFSVISCLVGIITVPYNALIVAHEKMGAFAYISLIELFLKLIIVLCLFYIATERLIIYAGLILLVSLINRYIYNYYCRKQFKETEVSLKGINWSLMKSLGSFSSWSVVGSLGYISHTQGIAIIINIFFGTLVNAAQGITNQVNSVITNFVGNFLVALKPQVVKQYAAGNLNDMHSFIIRGCRISFLMVAIFAIPILFATPALLNIWLTTVPPYTVIFIRLTMLITLFDSFTTLLATAQGATGKVKIYQIILTSIGLLHLPLAWLFFHWGYPPYWAMIIYLVIIITLQICRIGFVSHSTHLGVGRFMYQVVLPCFGCCASACVVPLALSLTTAMPEIAIGAIAEFLLLISIWYFGITAGERELITKYIKNKIHLRHVA